jgi:hypothetical protein
VNPWKVILATLVIFAAGMVTGGLAMKRLQPLPTTSKVPPSLQRVELLRRMAKRLDLTASQQERIEQIVGKARNGLKDLGTDPSDDSR